MTDADEARRRITEAAQALADVAERYGEDVRVDDQQRYVTGETPEPGDIVEAVEEQKQYRVTGLWSVDHVRARQLLPPATVTTSTAVRIDQLVLQRRVRLSQIRLGSVLASDPDSGDVVQEIADTLVKLAYLLKTPEAET